MVDVGHKPPMRRKAVAPRRRADGAGDGAPAARPAEGRRARRPRSSPGSWRRSATSELIPLCHPLPLSHVDVELEVGEGRVDITASAETTAQTGVEMEALTAVAVAGADRLRHGQGDRQGAWRSPRSRSSRRRRRTCEGGRPDRLRPRLARRGRRRERRHARGAAARRRLRGDPAARARRARRDRARDRRPRRGRGARAHDRRHRASRPAT